MPSNADKPKIAIGADHAGFHAKEAVKKFLLAQGYEIDDVGTGSEESVDYPDFARAVGERVASGRAQLGILACGTGIGMAITANKVPGIRAAVVHDIMTSHLAREHNDANVLTFGARLLPDDQIIAIVREFLNTSFADGRHQRRIDKIAAMDKK